MSGKVAVLGALDTKGAEFAFLKAQLARQGVEPLLIDFGVIGEPAFAPDIPTDEVAAAAGTSLAELRAANDRGTALATLARGAAALLRQLYDDGQVTAAIGMGGGATAMRALPVGVPKLLVSTMASGDTRPYVGSRDITLMYSVVDVAGVNRISRRIIANAAGAIAGMAGIESDGSAADKPLIAASMFGNTTQCVDRCRATMEAQGYEVLVFHATGSGGQTMESLIDDGFFAGVLDITTTEWADEVCGGVLSAGPARLEAAARAGVPQVVAPGCIDMCNFGPRAGVPERFAGRQLYEWNPTVTLMRTTPAENAQIGAIFAEKLNRATAPAHVLIPLKGFSILDSPGERFWSPPADAAFTHALKARLRPGIPVEELDLNINDPAFADRATSLLFDMLKRAT
jgi:uncharacterized protein (UPF0261 family)